MAFGTVAQAVDVIVRHRPGITESELGEAVNADVQHDCEWLTRQGYIRRDETTRPFRYFPGDNPPT
jgi:hypothetical protein